MKGFLGSNSMYGFSNHFDSCNNVQKEGKVFILKGGSGSGKSTLMRKCIEFLKTLGLECDEFYCSGDVDSLDGIYCAKLNIAVIDGTSPHVVDPSLYGIYEEVINMGDCLKSEELGSARKDLINYVDNKKLIYETCYSYLAAAGSLYNDSCKKYNADIIEDSIDVLAYDFCEGLKLSRGDMKYPFYRKFFMQGLTPTGLVDFSDMLYKDNKVYLLGGAFDSVYSSFLYTTASYAKMFMQNIDYILNPLDPKLVSGVVLKDINVAILCRGIFSSGASGDAVDIDLSPCMQGKVDKNVAGNNTMYINKMLECAYEQMAKAKAIHVELEAKYKPHMDFEKVNGKISQIITKIQQ